MRILISPLLFTLAVLTSLTGHADFSPKKLRFRSGREMINAWSQLLPGHKAFPTGTLPVDCITIYEGNRDITGTSAPSLKKPVSSKPSPAFVRWITKCTKKYSELDLKASTAQRLNLWKDYLPQTIATSKSISDNAGFLSWIESQSWSSLTVDQRKEILQHLTLRFVGPSEVFEVTKDGLSFDTYVDKLSAAIEGLQSGDKIKDKLLQSVIFIVTSEEYLRY